MADNKSEESQENAAAIPTDNGSLTWEEPTAAQSPGPLPLPRPLDRPALRDYDPRPHHDTARRRIAYWLLVLLSGLLVAIFACFSGFFFLKPPPTFDQFKTLIELILTPLLTLVSAATGFYFGSHNKS
ncbi:hypothetical protein [Cupriavidus sp. CuC1]|uniref:hypothetical protein n=1 Tax=Cupriavidus sp. CuC1 TaxID=3373131 RepID=UPI0037D62BAB